MEDDSLNNTNFMESSSENSSSDDDDTDSTSSKSQSPSSNYTKNNNLSSKFNGDLSSDNPSDQSYLTKHDTSAEIDLTDILSSTSHYNNDNNDDDDDNDDTNRGSSDAKNKDDDNEDTDDDDDDDDDNAFAAAAAKYDDDNNQDMDNDDEDDDFVMDETDIPTWDTRSNGSIEYDFQYPNNNNNEKENKNNKITTTTSNLVEKTSIVNNNNKINKDLDTMNNSEINKYKENNNFEKLSTNKNTSVVQRSLSPQPGCSKHFDTIEKSFNEDHNKKLIDKVNCDDVVYPHTIQSQANDIYNIINKLTLNSISNGLLNLQSDERKRIINDLNNFLPFYLKKGTKRQYDYSDDSDDCNIIKSKKIDDKIYPTLSSTSTMNFPGKGFRSLPQEVELIDDDNGPHHHHHHYNENNYKNSGHKKINKKNFTIDITSSDDEPLIQKSKLQKTTSKLQKNLDLKKKKKSKEAAASSVMRPAVLLHDSHDDDDDDNDDDDEDEDDDDDDNEYVDFTRTLNMKSNKTHFTVDNIPVIIEEELPVLTGTQTDKILERIESGSSTSIATEATHPVKYNNDNNNSSVPVIKKTSTLLNNKNNVSNHQESSTKNSNTVLSQPQVKTPTKSSKPVIETTNSDNLQKYTGTIPKQQTTNRNTLTQIINNIFEDDEPSSSRTIETVYDQFERRQQKLINHQSKKLATPLPSQIPAPAPAPQPAVPPAPQRTRDLLQQNLLQQQKKYSLVKNTDNYDDNNRNKIKPVVIRINDDNQHLPNKDNKKYCQEIYIKLRAMFPNIKPTYVQRFCPEEWSKNQSHENQLSQIIENLLSREHEWEYDVSLLDGSNDNVDEQLTVDDSYQQLIELFPNSEPGHMRQIAEMYYKKPDDLQSYIDRNLLKPSYPTREQYLAKLKTTEEQKRYTDNFDVNDFLELFPDPKEYFENPNRKCEFTVAASEFLKNHFKKNKVKTVTSTYQNCHYNLSLSARQLFNIGCDMKTTRNGQPYPTENIPLLQEIAYIKNIKIIENFIKDKKENEYREYNKMKAKNQLLECQCCFDNECVPSKVSTCEQGHTFCNDCIIKGTDSKMGDSDTHVKCFTNCDAEFSLATLQKILKPSKFRILLEKRQAAEVQAAGLTGLVSCPFCHFATIPPEGDKIFKCLNNDCMKESCIKCKELNHVPYRCDEVGKVDKTRKFIEEKMTEALSRVCYKCKKTFIKEEGCNKITCTCGAYMCYLCDKKITNYEHFRGQGSTELDRCPLYSDNELLNYQTVKKVAEELKKKLLSKDPTLNIDIDSMLPPKPKPKSGPHETIAGDPNLAAIHAARVLGTIK